MGKRIIQQARGKGGPTYKAPSFKYLGATRHRAQTQEEASGTVINILKCRGHFAPLAVIEYEDSEFSLIPAPEGVRVGQGISYGKADKKEAGSTLKLNNMPVGAMVYNIEASPGDGGKFCRSAGTYAKVISKGKGSVNLQLPSKKVKSFNHNCRAVIGVVAGSGRLDKPLLKAGNNYHKMRIKNKLYPRVSGGAVNAVDHPFGNARSSRKSKARVAPRNAPPGRKVGMIKAKRTGRRKR